MNTDRLLSSLGEEQEESTQLKSAIKTQKTEFLLKIHELESVIINMSKELEPLTGII
jgi:hypothetical protein